MTDNHNLTVESSKVEIWAVKRWGGFGYVRLPRVKCKVAKFEVGNSLITSSVYFLAMT